jgi:hypothetical protein
MRHENTREEEIGEIGGEKEEEEEEEEREEEREESIEQALGRAAFYAPFALQLAYESDRGEKERLANVLGNYVLLIASEEAPVASTAATAATATSTATATATGSRSQYPGGLFASTEAGGGFASAAAAAIDADRSPSRAAKAAAAAARAEASPASARPSYALYSRPGELLLVVRGTHSITDFLTGQVRTEGEICASVFVCGLMRKSNCDHLLVFLPPPTLSLFQCHSLLRNPCGSVAS